MSVERVIVVAAVIAVAIALLALLWPAARRAFIYPGGSLAPARADPALHGLPDSEQVWLETEDGVRLHAWWTPAREPAATRGAVVYCHGNAESMATRAWLADRLARLGLDVLLFDYRGYGLSEGRASEEGLARDARAAWRHVVEDRDVDPQRVILMGHSLGSAVATRLALEVQAEGERGADGRDDASPAALVVGSPFPDMPTLFRHHAPWLPGIALRWRAERFASGSRIADVKVPLLVLLAESDEVIPAAMTREVYERAGEPKRLVSVGTDHGTLMGSPAVWSALEGFLEDRLEALR